MPRLHASKNQFCFKALLYGALRRRLIEARGRPRVDGHIVIPLLGAHPSKFRCVRLTDVSRSFCLSFNGQPRRRMIRNTRSMDFQDYTFVDKSQLGCSKMRNGAEAGLRLNIPANMEHHTRMTANP